VGSGEQVDIEALVQELMDRMEFCWDEPLHMVTDAKNAILKAFADQQEYIRKLEKRGTG
jgi:hypothetical protein